MDDSSFIESYPYDPSEWLTRRFIEFDPRRSARMDDSLHLFKFYLEKRGGLTGVSPLNKSYVHVYMHTRVYLLIVLIK